MAGLALFTKGAQAATATSKAQMLLCLYQHWPTPQAWGMNMCEKEPA